MNLNKITFIIKWVLTNIFYAIIILIIPAPIYSLHYIEQLVEIHDYPYLEAFSKAFPLFLGGVIYSFLLLKFIGVLFYAKNNVTF